MAQERRRHARVSIPIDGQWRGGASGSFCRVMNVSMGGCFARASTAPNLEEPATVTIYFGKHGPLSFKGKVVHAEAKAGFGVQFEPLHHELKLQLTQHLDCLKIGNY